MLNLRDYSIRKKLTWICMLTSGAVLVLASAAFLAYEWTAFRGELLARLSTQAQIVGSNSAAALLFQDQPAAEQTLAALKAEPEIRAAAIYNREGRLFASYSRPGAQAESSLPRVAGLQADRESFEGGNLVLLRQIVQNGEGLGTVYIQSDLQGMGRRVRRYVVILLLILGASFLASFVIASRLQSLIAQPVLELAETAKIVSQGRDYSVRARPGNRDEVGLLIETFNQMLAQIEERDVELGKGREQLEQRVEQRTAELAATVKELEGFSYSVAHDLRAPLRHISGFSNMLAEQYGPSLDPNAQRYLERIQNGARQMGMLVDDLLNLARIGRQEMRCQATGLNSLLDEVLADLKPEADGRKVEWRIGRLPFVECDPSLMKQALYNLASNALKYTRPREKAVIEVDARVQEGVTVIVFRDNGVGFSMKYADKLFGVFQRLHRPEDFEGTGVGLATVQRIIHKHGGRVWAEGELDKGATFYFTLEPADQKSSHDKISTGAMATHDGTSS